MQMTRSGKQQRHSGPMVRKRHQRASWKKKEIYHPFVSTTDILGRFSKEEIIFCHAIPQRRHQHTVAVIHASKGCSE